MELKIFTTMLLALSLYGCADKRRATSDISDKKLVISKYATPPDDCQYFFYKVDNGYICQSTGHAIWHIYDDHYKWIYSSFETFRHSLISGKTPPGFERLKIFLLFERYIDYLFYPDKGITAFYERHGVNGLLNKYCRVDTTEGEIRYLAKDVWYNPTVAYYLWLNGYGMVVATIGYPQYVSKKEYPTKWKDGRIYDWKDKSYYYGEKYYMGNRY